MRTSSTSPGLRARDPDRAGEQVPRLVAQRAVDVVQLGRHVEAVRRAATSGVPVTVCRVTRSPGWTVSTGGEARIEAAPMAGRGRGRELVMGGRHRQSSSRLRS